VRWERALIEDLGEFENRIEPFSFLFDRQFDHVAHDGFS